MLRPDDQVIEGVVEMVVRELYASSVGQLSLDVSLPCLPDAWFLDEDHADVKLQVMGPREIRACRRTPTPERLEEACENGPSGHIDKLGAVGIGNLQRQRFTINRLRIKRDHAHGALLLAMSSRWLGKDE